MRQIEPAPFSPSVAEPVLVLDRAAFERARHLISELAGIKLSVHKRQMVHNRLSRRLRANGIMSFGEYLDLVERDAREREAFVNALTTNLTAFFREPHHFDLLAAHAVVHLRTQRRPLRVWCSASSTGEEAWSIAMTLREVGCPAEVLATDIDTDALDTATAGVYPAERAAALSAQRRRSHLLRGIGANDGWVTVRPELRTMVRFSQLNLQSPEWPAMEPFDVVFCRNVVIYFDRDAQKRLLERFTRVLRPGGLLVVGHAESFPAAHPAFHACGRTAYVFGAG